MEHLFLNKELSQLAKDKGFKEPCFAHYKEKENYKFCPNNRFVSEMAAVMFPDEGERGINVDSFSLLCNENQNKYVNWIAAPLYQQIITWLNEAGKDRHLNILILFDGFVSITKKETNKAIKKALNMI